MNTDYVYRINRAIDYIFDHLEENITVEDIAQHCYFSKYYFNRIFKSVTGESIYAFVKRLRIEKAAFLLQSSISITDIAYKYGFSSTHFSTTFKKHFSMTPNQYKSKIKGLSKRTCNLDLNGFIIDALKQEKWEEISDKITITYLDNMRLMYERYIGDYRELPPYWEAFRSRTSELVNEKVRYIGISYDSPMITDVNRCIYDICISFEKSTRILDNHNYIDLVGGKYLKYNFEDKIDKIYIAYQELFTIWLPNMTHELDDRKLIEIYPSNLDNKGHINFDIYIPIK